MKLAIVILLAVWPVLSAFELPKDSKQCVVGVAQDWNSSHVTLHCYEKKGSGWTRVKGPWKGRLGRSGLIWGKGLHPNPEGSKTKN